MPKPPDIDIIEAVLTRPNMYTTNSTVGEASSFLAGYFWGSKELKVPPNSIENWPAFNMYLREQINPNSVNFWKEIEQKFA